MSVYVRETPDGDLRIVKSGVETRLPLTDRQNHVRIPADAPEWASRVANDHGYTPVEPPVDHEVPTPQPAE